jgi:hypothetical protein
MTTKDMLQVLIKGQDALQEGHGALQKGYDALLKGQNELKGELAILREETRDGFRENHERLDKQGQQLAFLDDDAPTREEHDSLVKRVEKIEKVISS